MLIKQKKNDKILLLDLFMQGRNEIKTEEFSYLDRNAYLFIQANLFHLEGCPFIKKVNYEWLL